MSTSDNTKTKIYKLPQLKDDGSNYNAWKFRQTTVLKLRGLFGVANGTDNLPDSLTEAKQKDESKVSHYKDSIAKWTRRDEDAFAQITLNMEDGAMADVMDTTTARQAWTRIIERWEGKGVQSLSFLYQQLTSTKILEDDDIATGLNNLLSIASKMKTLGEPVSDLMMAQIMMNALPPTYAIVNTVIQTTNQASAVTPQMVKEAAPPSPRTRNRPNRKTNARRTRVPHASTPVLYALPATDSQTSNNSWRSLTSPIHVRVGNGKQIPAAGIGRIFLVMRNRQGNEHEAIMKEVLHVPELHANLMSVQELVSNGTEVAFGKDYGAVLVANQGQGPKKSHTSD